MFSKDYDTVFLNSKFTLSPRKFKAMIERLWYILGENPSLRHLVANDKIIETLSSGVKHETDFNPFANVEELVSLRIDEGRVLMPKDLEVRHSRDFVELDQKLDEDDVFVPALPRVFSTSNPSVLFALSYKSLRFRIYLLERDDWWHPVRVPRPNQSKFLLIILHHSFTVVHHSLLHNIIYFNLTNSVKSHATSSLSSVTPTESHKLWHLRAYRSMKAKPRQSEENTFRMIVPTVHQGRNLDKAYREDEVESVRAEYNPPSRLEPFQHTQGRRPEIPVEEFRPRFLAESEEFWS
ncbi:hypothetical protein BDZ45DRAFT_689336 [Acephala macrosclerotiorum]|nr:hypothetical protein BDZ45DRAFT_689336 [Acephala macrosclerotiorum]